MATLTDDSPADARFSDALRSGTSSEHRDAEGSAFARGLLRGEIGPAGYAALVAQLHFVYSALEDASEIMRADPVASAFVFDELLRRPALEADLAFLLGSDWRDQIEALPSTIAYCSRLREVGTTWPGGFVAHHYTRYLGDLSGGQTIRRVVSRTYGWDDGDGVQFYLFPAIADAKAFKATYRERLDAAPWTVEERARIIEESGVAFRHNGAMLRELSSYAS